MVRVSTNEKGGMGSRNAYHLLIVGSVGTRLGIHQRVHVELLFKYSRTVESLSFITNVREHDEAVCLHGRYEII
jgi:hypothetical protein